MRTWRMIKIEHRRRPPSRIDARGNEIEEHNDAYLLDPLVHSRSLAVLSGSLANLSGQLANSHAFYHVRIHMQMYH